jgi:hypothetical protein
VDEGVVMNITDLIDRPLPAWMFDSNTRLPEMRDLALQSRLNQAIREAWSRGDDWCQAEADGLVITVRVPPLEISTDGD